MSRRWHRTSTQTEGCVICGARGLSHFTGGPACRAKVLAHETGSAVIAYRSKEKRALRESGSPPIKVFAHQAVVPPWVGAAIETLKGRELVKVLAWMKENPAPGEKVETARLLGADYKAVLRWIAERTEDRW